MAKILVAGLNPAWQKILEFDSLQVGEVNRARDLIQMASGKGLNAAKVLRRLGHEVHLLQVLGGANGQRCLVACQALGLQSLHIWVEEETRQCLTLVDMATGAATEIIEPFEIETPGAMDDLLSLIPPGSAYDAVLFSGTVPKGLPLNLQASIRERIQARVTLLDAWQGVDAAFLSKVGYVKVNRREHTALVPQISGSGPLFMVTDGAGEALVHQGVRLMARIPVPRLERVRNPIGAGDTVSAGTLHFLVGGLDPVEAFRRGLAMGSASCLDLEPAQFAWSAYEALLPGIGPAVKVS